jgi:hypothetical protein
MNINEKQCGADIGRVTATSYGMIRRAASKSTDDLRSLSYDVVRSLNEPLRRRRGNNAGWKMQLMLPGTLRRMS